MYLSILIYPLLNYIFCGMLGRFFGRRGAYCLSIFFLGFSFLFSAISFYSIIKYNFIVEITLFKWASFDSLMFSCTFLYDSISCVMLFVVTSISFLVHIYSGYYMEDDPYLPRFLSFLSLFTFFMLFFVLSGNFFQLFLGWEGIGLCSYLLINFWYTRAEANKSAIKAVIINKVGDFGFFFGIILCAVLTKGVDFSLVYPTLLSDTSLVIQINALGYTFGSCHAITLICFFFLIGVVGKSAQVGLHTWLPDAMEGPTPVSALIHAATMVTAGVFLIIRTSYLFEHSPLILSFLVIIGSLTAFFSGTIALFQFDMKKVIAYSTCSQLGYMVLSCGLSGYDLALFHLFNHAFFKALLFLSSGIIIHFFKNEQDIRKYGFVFRVLPFIFYSMLIGSLSLMGVPYLSGFYSKDKILELAFYTNDYISFIGYFFGLFAAFLTAAYSSRLLYLIFFFTLERKSYFFAPQSINKPFLFSFKGSYFKRSFNEVNNIYYTGQDLFGGLLVFCQSMVLSSDFYFLVMYRLPGAFFFGIARKFVFYFVFFYFLPDLQNGSITCLFLGILSNRSVIFFFLVFLFSIFLFMFFPKYFNFFSNYFFSLYRSCYKICLSFKLARFWLSLRLDNSILITAPRDAFYFFLVVFRAMLFLFYFNYVLFFIFSMPYYTLRLYRGLWKLIVNEYLILFPLMVLLFGSIFSGYFFYDLFLGVGSSFFDGSIFMLMDTNFTIEMYNSRFIDYTRYPAFFIWKPEPSKDAPATILWVWVFQQFHTTDIFGVIPPFVLPTFVKLLPFFFSIFGFFALPFCYDNFFQFNLKQLNSLNFKFFHLFIFFNKKWFFDNLFLSFSLSIFFFFFKMLLVVDKGFLEQLGPGGLKKAAQFFARYFKGFQNGSIIMYLQWLGFYLFIYLFIFFLWF